MDGWARLAEVLSDVGAAPDLVSALEALLRGAIRALGAHRGSADVFDPRTGDLLLKLRVEHDGTLGVQHKPDPPSAIGFAWQALSRGQPVVVHDMQVMQAGNAEWSQRGMHASLYMAIQSRGQRIGTFHIDHPRPRYFADADLTLTQALATQGGAVIDRARLDAAREERVRLDGALLMARTVAHEINNALAPVIGFAELLSLHPAVTADLVLRTYAQHIFESGQDAAAKIRRLQHIVRLEEDSTASAAEHSVLALDRSTAPALGDEHDRSLER